MFCLEVLNCLQHNIDVKETQREFFISSVHCGQSVFSTVIFPPHFSSPKINSTIIFSFSDDKSHDSSKVQNSRFKMILWSIVAGTRGGINRAKILSLIATTPMNANKIATVLNLDHKTVVHHVKILSKNELIVKAEKEYAAEYALSKIMGENKEALEEIMQKIGTN